MTPVERLFVWTSGALFVLALAATAYTYLVVWSTPAPENGTRRAVAVDATLFGVFALHHSVFARERVKAALARVLPERLVRSVYVCTASVLLLAVLAIWREVGGSIYEVTGWRAVGAVLVQLSGLWLIVRAVSTIDPLELAGIRQAHAADTLHIKGPYRWVRHPIYLGWALMLFGTTHMTGDRLAFAVISGGYLVAGIPFEERSLERTFGNQYRQYRQRVRWRILPFLY